MSDELKTFPVIDAVVARRVTMEDAVLVIDRSFSILVVRAATLAFFASMAALLACVDHATRPMWFVAALCAFGAIDDARLWWVARRKHLDAVARVSATLEAMKADEGKVTT